jgi:hypothetical protein
VLPLEDIAACCAAGSNQVAATSSFLSVLETVAGQTYGTGWSFHQITQAWVQAILGKGQTLEGGKGAFSVFSHTDEHYR